MSRINALDFCKVLEDAGYEPRSYSGRGMFGTRCVSISGNSISAWKVASSLWFNNFDEIDLDVPEPRQDQLGLGIVLYWPTIEWTEECEEQY